MTYMREFVEEDGKATKIFLSAQEEREREQVARQENLFLVRQCIFDARNVLKDEKMMDMQSHVLSIAMVLFKKRAKHAEDYKAEKCLDKHLKYWGKSAKGKRSKSASSSAL